MVTMSSLRKSRRPVVLAAGNLVRNRARLFDRLGRKFVREMMLADHDLDIDAEIVLIAQNFNDTSDAVFAVLREFEHLDIDDHAVEVLDRLDFQRSRPDTVAHPVCRGTLRRHLHAFRNLNPLLNAIVRRNHKVAAFSNPELTHDRDMSTTQNPNDLTLGTAFVCKPRDVYQRPIPVHAFRGFAGRKKHIALHVIERLIGNQKTEPVAMNGEPPAHIFGIRTDGYEVTRAKFNQLAFVGEPVERVLQGIAIFALQLQLAHELLKCCARVGKIANVFENARVGESLGVGTRGHYPQL